MQKSFIIDAWLGFKHGYAFTSILPTSCFFKVFYTLFFYKNLYILFEASCSSFFFIFETTMFLICSYFPTETCNATKKNVRLSTIKTHDFISFILFLSSSAYRQAMGGVLRKVGSATVLKPITKYLPWVQLVVKVARFKSQLY